MQSTLDYLYSLERLGIKLGLETITKILEVLGNPHQQFKTIHVTGTNGKGSTCAFLASILQEASYKTGLYTSPHLVKFNERIKVNGQDIDDKELLALVEEIKGKCEHLQPTFFEFTTAMAFLYFARQKVDLAVIEVGMGGRLDATNVIIPEVAIITNVELDHLQHLGTTKEAIAQEKAAIIKAGIPLVTGEITPQILAYFKEECRKKESAIFAVEEQVQITPLSSSLEGQSFQLSGFVNKDFSLKMLGEHQLQNAATALIAAELLKQKGWKLPPQSIKEGLAHTYWPGRLQILSRQPWIMVDGAHNVSGMKTAVKFLSILSSQPQRQVLLLGIAEDKDIPILVKIIVPWFKKVIITQGSYKPAPANIIAQEARKYLSEVWEIPDSEEAFNFAQTLVQDGELLFCTGSLYLIGDVLKACAIKP